MITRQATSADIKELAPLFNQYRVFYIQQSNLNAATSFISERFRHKDSHFIIAFNEDNTAMGFTQLYPSFSSVSMQRTYILNDLFVAEHFRKKGVGKALLNAAKKFALNNNAKGLTLETDTKNPAQHLYERLNWKKDDSVLHYTWTPQYDE